MMETDGKGGNNVMYFSNISVIKIHFSDRRSLNLHISIALLHATLQ